MSFRQWLQRILERQVIQLEPRIYEQIADLAERQQRPPETVAADLLSLALEQQQQADEGLHYWETLSPREQEVAALTCLGYTNAEIAKRLHIALPTVKTHIRNILRKFGLSNRTELQRLLSGWDFSEWERLL